MEGKYIEPSSNDESWLLFFFLAGIGTSWPILLGGQAQWTVGLVATLISFSSIIAADTYAFMGGKVSWLLKLLCSTSTMKFDVDLWFVHLVIFSLVFCLFKCHYYEICYATAVREWASWARMTDWYRLDSTVNNLRYGYHGQMWNPIFPFLIGMQSKFNQ